MQAMMIHLKIYKGKEYIDWSQKINPENIKTPAALLAAVFTDDTLLGGLLPSVTFVSFKIDDAKGCIIPYWITRCGGRISFNKGKWAV
jgi:hypothetical protein